MVASILGEVRLDHHFVIMTLTLWLSSHQSAVQQEIKRLTGRILQKEFYGFLLLYSYTGHRSLCLRQH